MARARQRPQDERPPDAILMRREDGEFHDEDIRAFVDYVKGLARQRAREGARPAQAASPGPCVEGPQDPDP